MIDSDKIVSLNSLVEHTDMSVLKNIAHISGGPLSIASTGKTICFPNKITPKINHKIPEIKRSKLLFSSTGESKFSTKVFEKFSDNLSRTQGESFYHIILIIIIIIIIIIAIIIIINCYYYYFYYYDYWYYYYYYYSYCYYYYYYYYYYCYYYYYYLYYKLKK